MSTRLHVWLYHVVFVQGVLYTTSVVVTGRAFVILCSTRQYT